MTGASFFVAVEALVETSSLTGSTGSAIPASRWMRSMSKWFSATSRMASMAGAAQLCSGVGTSPM